MVEPSPAQHRHLLSNPWFASIDAAIRAEVLACAWQRELARGQCLFRRGDTYDGVYGVLEGSVRVSGNTQAGHEAILTFYEPGAWFGEISAFDGLPRTHDLHAHAPSVLLWLRPADFEALLQRHPVLPRLFLRLECARLRLMSAALEEFSTRSFESRLAGRLLALAAAFGAGAADGLGIQLHLPQETLANLVGSTRQRVNQVLQEWERAGRVVVQRGRIVLVDTDALHAIAQADGA